MRGLFVTGTDTGVGKTVVAAAICAALRERGEDVAAFKPVVTGLDEDVDPAWPRDHELLARVCGQEPSSVAPLTFGPPASPHLAAALEGVHVEPPELLAAARVAGERARAVVVEGVGGLLVPLTLGYSIRDFAVDLALPVVVAARPGLGTISHTLLTLEAARAAGLTVAGVVFTPWPAAPTTIEGDNRATVQRLGGVPVAALPPIERGDPDLLARAASDLPVGDWLS